MIISLHGSLVEENQAMVSVYDHGFLYGIGLFETFRTYGGVPFLLDEHLNRLSEGCAELGIQYTPQTRKLRETIERLLQVNGLKDGYIRLSISAGVQPLGLPSGDYLEPTEIIYVKALPEQPIKEKPLQTLELRRNTPEGPLRMKSSHYMNNILGLRELQQYTWSAGAEGLFMNASDHIAEGVVSNVFFIKRDVLCTPSLDTGILPGITRAFILDVADKLDIVYEESLYSLDWLSQADDIFITNSIQGITPVSCIYAPDGSTIWTRDITSDKQLDPIIIRLMEGYQEAIEGGY